MMRVGFIGLGSQGAPMARRIVEGGYPLTLWARRPASVEPFADTAAEVAVTPAQLAAASDLVCLCVVGDDDVREVLGGEQGVLSGLAAGGVVAIHSTVHPDTCREIADTAAAQGVSVIDAPVSGGAPAASEGTLLVMAGGDQDVVERCRPVFATYADPIVHLGPLGSGQVTKILNNLLFSANLGAAMSTLELGDALDIPRDKLCEVLARGSATSKALGSIAVFGGSLEGLAPIAGALLQQGRPARREPGRPGLVAGGFGVHRRRHRPGPDGASPVSAVGFVGAGRMGAPMVRRLVEAGHTVQALGRTPDKRREVEELGAVAVTDLATVADEADAVIVCVFTDEQVRELCLDSDLSQHMRPGATLVIHTTGSPGTAESVAARADGHGVQVLDAPVSGGPHDVAAGRVTLFVGGADDAVERVRPLLACYGDPVCHVGPVGSGQGVKLVNNALFAAQIGLVVEAVRLGERLGVAESTLLTALSHGSASSRVLDIVSARGSVESFVQTVGEFVGKDVAVVRRTAAELGGLGLLDDVVDAALDK